MKDSVRIFEGDGQHDGTDGLAPVVVLPVADGSTTGGAAPHPVYSLDGLMALALAVRRLEASE